MGVTTILSGCVDIFAYFLELTKVKDLKSSQQKPREIMTTAFQVSCLMCHCPGALLPFESNASAQTHLLLPIESSWPEHNSIHTRVGYCYLKSQSYSDC